jgi:hypothetical protein
MGVSAVGLVVLLALASQILADRVDQALLLVVCEAAAGIGLLVGGFALMVVGADPFDDADGTTGGRINGN